MACAAVDFSLGVPLHETKSPILPEPVMKTRLFWRNNHEASYQIVHCHGRARRSVPISRSFAVVLIATPLAAPFSGAPARETGLIFAGFDVPASADSSEISPCPSP